MLAVDQGTGMGNGLVHALAVGTGREVHANDVVPRPHARAIVDGHRAHRRMREHKAQCRPFRAHQFGHQRHEVMSIRTQAVQPDDRPLRRRPGFLFDGFQQIDSVVHVAIVADNTGAGQCRPRHRRPGSREAQPPPGAGPHEDAHGTTFGSGHPRVHRRMACATPASREPLADGGRRRHERAQCDGNGNMDHGRPSTPRRVLQTTATGAHDAVG